jgi:hypothetical protein
VCLNDFELAARISDEAYPAGSDPADELEHAIAASVQLQRVLAFEKHMPHGIDSFLYGLVEGLVESQQFEAAKMGVKNPVL